MGEKGASIKGEDEATARGEGKGCEDIGGDNFGGILTFLDIQTQTARFMRYVLLVRFTSSG